MREKERRYDKEEMREREREGMKKRR